MTLPPDLAHFESASEQQTMDYGRRLARCLPKPALLLLSGELGSGKTVLVKGLAEGLRVADAADVVSPTYTLIHEYRSQGAVLFHIDLYRIDSWRELSTLGLEDVLQPSPDQPAIIAVEWGKKFKIFEKGLRIEIDLRVSSDSGRVIRAQWIEPHSVPGQSADTPSTPHTSNK